MAGQFQAKLAMRLFEIKSKDGAELFFQRTLKAGLIKSVTMLTLFFVHPEKTFLKRQVIKNLNKTLTKLSKRSDLFLRDFGVFLIKVYQLFLGFFLGGNCRFYPSCSEYCKSAYQNFDFMTASYLSGRRLIRCRPFGDEGYDPLPEIPRKVNHAK